MQKIRSTETTPEILFRKALWAKGVRYRKNNAKLPGKPDISISRYKTVVFIDGEFWHGFNWKRKKRKIRSNRGYWIPKIERNIKRDKKNSALLKKEGWAVIRFWEADIKKKPEQCLKKALVIIKIQKRKHG